MRVIWRAAALDDQRRVYEYLAMHNPGAAAQVVEAIIRAADSLSTFPNRGRLGRVAGTRELLTAFTYVLVYEVFPETESVNILRVWHGAQDR